MRPGNLIKMGWGVLGVNLYGLRKPLNVMLSVTNRCVASCSYCNIPNRSQQELSTSEIYSLIDQIAKMGCVRLGLWGGEPLIRNDIGEIVNYAKSKGLFVTLDSNGYFLPQKIKTLSSLDHLILALDGDEHAHNLNRGSGSFQRVMAAIEAAKGKIPFWTITVLTKNNLDSIDFILNKAREYNFLATFQLLHHNEKLSRNHESLLPSYQQYSEVIKKLILEKKKNAPMASSLSYLYHILNWADYSCPTVSGRLCKIRCWAGRAYCNVDTDGSVYPCSLLVEKMDALNFLGSGFKKAFESMRLDSCKSCLASCFTEYNHIYSLNIGTIFEWLNSFQKTRKAYAKK